MEAIYTVHEINEFGGQLTGPIDSSGEECVDVDHYSLEDAEETALHLQQENPENKYGVFILLSRTEEAANGEGVYCVEPVIGA